jgi:hypothetical protein
MEIKVINLKFEKIQTRRDARNYIAAVMEKVAIAGSSASSRRSAYPDARAAARPVELISLK